MSDISSSSHQDIHQSVPAALEWESDHHLHYIAEPDPRVHDITLDTSFCAETSFALLKLYFPMYLKGFAGLTRACILIDPSSLESFNHTYNATIPDVVRKKLNCKTVRLDLRLKPERNFIIIAPTSANEPLTSARAHSGIVLDALRSLSGVTSCSIFVAASKMASSTLQAFSKAVKSGHLKPLPYQLPSMFGGAGGKIIQFSAGANDTLPPSYDEDEYESQSISNPKKRLRQNSQGPFADRSDFILAELNELRTLVLSENKQLKERLKAMESAAEKLQGVHDLENMKLRIANSLVLSENQKLKDRVEAMEAEVERLQADHDVVSMKQDSLNDNLLEMNENLEDLTERVEFLRLCNQDNDNKTLLKDEIIDEIATRLRQD